MGWAKLRRGINDRKIRIIGVVRMPTTRVGVPGVARGLGSRLRMNPGLETGSKGSTGKPDRHQQKAARRHKPVQGTAGVVSLCAHGSIHT